MNLLDMRTVILGYIISNGVCAVVIGSLWFQSRKRFAGLGLWLADFVMQFAALLLVALRGRIPDILSTTGSNTLIVGGTILLYMGLEKFLGKPGKQFYNVILLVAFISAHLYFLEISPSLEVRNILFSLGLLAVCIQCGWLMLHRVDREFRSYTRTLGLVFLAFCMVNVARIFIDIIVHSDNDFFHSNSYDTLLVMIYQMLFIILALGLFLMVNRRLLVELESDITERKRAEDALRLSEEKFFKAFHSSPDAILITRLSDGKLVEVNDGFSHLTGYSREEALKNSTITMSIWVNPQDRERYITALMGSELVRNHEYEFRKKSGKILNGLCSGEIVYFGDEAYILSIVRDITEHKQAEQALRESREDFQRYFNMSTIGMCVTSPEKGWIEVNDRLCQMLGYAKEELRDLTWAELTHPDDLDADITLFNQLLSGERESYDLDKSFVHKDGSRVYTTLYVTCHRNPDRSVGYVLASLIDITERKQVEVMIQLRLKLLEYSIHHSLEELMQKALDEIGQVTKSPIGFYHFVEPDQKTLSLKAWSTRTLKEFCHAEGRGMHYNIDQAGVWVDCVHQRRPVIHNNYAALPHRKGLPEGHAEVIRELVVPTMRNGLVVSILGVGNKPSEYDGKDIEFVSYIADIVWVLVERKRAEEKIQLLQDELREQAMRDPLTGLYNRRYLNDTVDREIARAKRGGYPVSFVMIDIDHFKNLNDTFGHNMGDTVLQHFAAQLMNQTRIGDIVYRYGGEEFFVILPNVIGESAFEIAERWRKSLQENPLLHEGKYIGTTVSCGISEFPAHGNLKKDLIAAADKAMYQAKANGRNQIVVWQGDPI